MIRSINQEQFSCHLKKEDWNKILAISLKVAVQFKGNSIVYSTALEIILEILSQISVKDLDGNFNEVLDGEFDDLGRSMAEKNIAMLRLATLKQNLEFEEGNYLVSFDLNTISFDYLQGILNIILIILDYEYVVIMAEEFGIEERCV